MTNTATLNHHWQTTRDDLGRRVWQFSTVGARTDAVVVSLPTSFVDAYPEVGRYLVSFWMLPVEMRDLFARHFHVATEARAYVESTVASLRAIPADLSLADAAQLAVARIDAQRDVRVAEGASAMRDLTLALNRLADVERALAG